jgi:hypothetical protein
MARGAVLKVACVLRRSPEYDQEYVQRLKAGVDANLSIPHQFVCLSDADLLLQETPWIRLEHKWPAWWAKLELFNSDELEPPVLYFDLDTIITGSLDEIAAAALSHPFIVLRDFYREKGIGSGMMAWNTSHRYLYEEFRDWDELWRETLGTKGDQAFLEKKVKSSPASWQDVLPGQVCSYKVHVKGKGVPQNCRVVCFHGKPKPRVLNWTL